MLEESACGDHVARRRHTGIDDLAVSVDRAVDVMPAAAYSSVGLVHSPVRTYGVAVLASHLAERRQKALHPAIDRALIDQDSVLGQPVTDFGVAEAIAHIPADGQGNDVVQKAAARERGEQGEQRASAQATDRSWPCHDFAAVHLQMDGEPAWI